MSLLGDTSHGVSWLAALEVRMDSLGRRVRPNQKESEEIKEAVKSVGAGGSWQLQWCSGLVGLSSLLLLKQ